MKKNILILNTVLISIFSFFISCKKEIKDIYQDPVTDSSHISITNASPVVPDLRFYLNNKFIPLPDSPLSYGKTIFATYITNTTTYHPDTLLLPYINIPSGYQQLGFGSIGNNNLFSVINNNFDSGGSYSIFITDTVIHGRVTSVILKDNLGAIDSTHGLLRFINLSPDAPPLDFWAYPNAGYTGYKVFSGCAYIPDNYNSFINAESFLAISAGPYYFEATVAGTSNAVLGGLMIVPGKNVITIYTKGYFSGTGANVIDVGVIQYKP